MQTRFAAGTPSGPPITLLDMVGVEYGVVTARPPGLFIIHKRYRHGPAEAEVIGSFYVLDGTIFQSPNLLGLLSSRLTSSLAYLSDAIMMASDNLTYDPAEKRYSTEASSDVNTSTAPIDPVEARALGIYYSLT